MSDSDIFKNEQSANLAKMSYATIHSSSYAAASSMAHNLYLVANDLYAAILDIQSNLRDTDKTVENAQELVAGFVDEYKNHLTQETSIKSLKTFLTNKNIKTKSTAAEPDFSVAGSVEPTPPPTPGTNASAAQQQMPVLNNQGGNTGVVYDLGKACPHFSGKGDEDVARWLLIVNNLSHNLGIPEKHRLSCVIRFTKLAAQETTVAAISRYGYEDWASYQNLMIRTFQPIDYQDQLRRKLKYMKQSGPIDVFNREFITLTNRIDNMADYEKMQAYIEALKGRTAYEVKAKQPSFLEEAMIVATNFENLTKEKHSEINSTFVQKSKSKTSQSNAVKCYNCGKIGHKSNVCRSAKVNENKDGGAKKASTKPVTCHKCKKVGHYANKCNAAKKPLEHNTLQLTPLYSEIVITPDSTQEEIDEYFRDMEFRREASGPRPAPGYSWIDGCGGWTWIGEGDEPTDIIKPEFDLIDTPSLTSGFYSIAERGMSFLELNSIAV